MCPDGEDSDRPPDGQNRTFIAPTTLNLQALIAAVFGIAKSESHPLEDGFHFLKRLSEATAAL